MCGEVNGVNVSAYEQYLLSMRDRMGEVYMSDMQGHSEEPEPVECDDYEEEYDKMEGML